MGGRRAIFAKRTATRSASRRRLPSSLGYWGTIGLIAAPIIGLILGEASVGQGASPVAGATGSKASYAARLGTTAISDDGQIISGDVTGLVTACRPRASYAEVDLTNNSAKSLSVYLEVEFVVRGSEGTAVDATRSIQAGHAAVVPVHALSTMAPTATCKLIRVTATSG